MYFFHLYDVLELDLELVFRNNLHLSDIHHRTVREVGDGLSGQVAQERHVGA
jgi:hypothetical protein